MKIGIIQQSCSASVEENRKKLAKSITKLAKEGAELVVLQELHDSLYFCQTEDTNNFRFALPIPGEATDFYSKVAKESQVVLVTSLFEKRTAGLYHNT
ncbi:MAG: acyltransferase, partial [Bacteroidaceae bacterium]|nr:acyltransferase [Bacteroidaceae bacterium]